MQLNRIMTLPEIFSFPFQMSRLFLRLRRTFSKDATTTTTAMAENVSEAVTKLWRPKHRRVGAVGIKLGMQSHYDKWGRRHPITVLRVQC